MDIFEQLDQYKSDQTKEVITFREYFERVRENTSLVRLSHARLHDMLMNKGVDKDGNCLFFVDDLFGIEKSISQIVSYFASAAQRLEVRKRLLLMVGPVSTGKSTVATALKRGLEKYTRTNDGILYRIQGCPMSEEPLHLIPKDMRPNILKEFGIYIEGSLCPLCQLKLREEWKGDVQNVLIEKFYLSEDERVGIGTFLPAPEKDQDLAELVGGLNLATIGEFGHEADPRAYVFNGELNISNRGMMEFVEILKANEKFLYVLLTLTQEQNIKTGRFPMLYADEVIVGHTNVTEYHNFVNDKKNEALVDRMVVVQVPYNLRLSEEIKIYEKLLRESNVGNVHIAPNTLKVASMFAILSRLGQDKNNDLTLVKKMKLYNGEDVQGFKHTSIEEIKKECPNEGMDGISPRYVINRISAAVVKDNRTCINAIDGLRALKDGLEQYPGISVEQKDKWQGLIATAREEFDTQAKKDAQRAFVHSYDESANTLFQNYLDNAIASVEEEKLKDPITEEEMEPDEKLMRSIEEGINVIESGKKAFREEIIRRSGVLQARGGKFTWESHPRLKEAIELKLFGDLQDMIKLTTTTKVPDKEQTQRINEVIEQLKREGYCEKCASELIRYVGSLLNR